jgi:hypothetical protein
MGASKYQIYFLCWTCYLTCSLAHSYDIMFNTLYLLTTIPRTQALCVVLWLARPLCGLRGLIWTTLNISIQTMDCNNLKNSYGFRILCFGGEGDWLCAGGGGGGGGYTKHFISFEGRRLLQIMLGNILVTFCIWSNFLWYQQLQATSSSKCIIFGNLLLKFLKIILFIER